MNKLEIKMEKFFYKMKYLIVLLVLLCGCNVTTLSAIKLDEEEKRTLYRQSKESGYVYYVNALCFDYPMGEGGNIIFRDATAHEIMKTTNRKYIDWDIYNNWCEEYLGLTERDSIGVYDCACGQERLDYLWSLFDRNSQVRRRYDSQRRCDDKQK